MKSNVFGTICTEWFLKPAVIIALFSLASMSGCMTPLSTRVPDKVDNTGSVSRYQRALIVGEAIRAVDANDVNEMPTLDTSDRTVPAASPAPTVDASALQPRELTLAQAITATLAHSEEIHVISYDPALAEQEVKKSAGEFDVTAFGRTNYDDGDKPISSFSEIAESDVALFESGVEQRSILGSEWSASYLLTVVGMIYPHVTRRHATSRSWPFNSSSPCGGTVGGR